MGEEFEKERVLGNRLAADLDEKGREVDERQRELVGKERELSESEREVELLTRELDEKNAVIKELNEKLAQLDKSIQQVLKQRDETLQERNTEVARLVVANRELSMEAESREQDVQGLEEQVSTLTTKIDSLGVERKKLLLEISHITESKFEDLAALEEARKEEVTTLESEKSVLMQEIDKVRLDWASEVLELRSRHEKEVHEGREELRRSREEWGVEREKLFGRVRACERKCGEWKEVVKRREREFEEVRGLAGRLIGMTGAGGFEARGVLRKRGREQSAPSSSSSSSSSSSQESISPELGLEPPPIKHVDRGGRATSCNEKKKNRLSTIQVPFSGRPSSPIRRSRKSAQVLRQQESDDGINEGDVIPESSESFLQLQQQEEESRPSKKTRKSIVANTSILGMGMGVGVGVGRKQREEMVGVGVSVARKQHTFKREIGGRGKKRKKGWSTSIYSRQGDYGKGDPGPPRQGGDGGGEPEVRGSGTTVEDNSCREERLGDDDGGGGSGSDGDTEYAFGESVEFTSTPKTGVVVGRGEGGGGGARGDVDGTTVAE